MTTIAAAKQKRECINGTVWVDWTKTKQWAEKKSEREGGGVEKQQISKIVIAFKLGISFSLCRAIRAIFHQTTSLMRNNSQTGSRFAYSPFIEIVRFLFFMSVCARWPRYIDSIERRFSRFSSSSFPICIFSVFGWNIHSRVPTLELCYVSWFFFLLLSLPATHTHPTCHQSFCYFILFYFNFQQKRRTRIIRVNNSA